VRAFFLSLALLVWGCCAAAGEPTGECPSAYDVSQWRCVATVEQATCPVGTEVDCARVAGCRWGTTVGLGTEVNGWGQCCGVNVDNGEAWTELFACRAEATASGMRRSEIESD
jgi:hypothetical protein